MDQSPGAVSILVVDDDEMARLTNKTLCEEVKETDCAISVCEASSMPEALNLIDQKNFQIIILDFDLGPNLEDNARLTSIPYIPQILGKQPEAKIYVMTAHDDLTTAVEAVRNGARSYLLKGGDEQTAQLRAHELASAIKQAQKQVQQDFLDSRTDHSHSEFIASSPAMKVLKNRLANLAEIEKPVLLLGETGLGKGSAAKKLNEFRAKFLNQTNRPFLQVNMASLTKELATTELFGYESGAFTGSKPGGKLGFFDAANNGDLFLDEIGELHSDLQAALLKVIEDREFLRVGGNKAVKTSARIICATNRDLLQMVQDGTFREDLYMRLATFVIELPPLSKRKSDIPEITQSILNKIGRETKTRPVKYFELPGDYTEHLMNNLIHGNIRGIEIELNQIIFNCPKDNLGRPKFENWRSAITSRAKLRVTKPQSNEVTLNEFMKLKTDFLGKDFPGLKKLKQMLETKILLEASEKYKTTRDRSKALKMQESNISVKYKRLAMENSITEEVTRGSNAVL
jgi:DNA-binding NtrC family response regulator